MSTSYYEALKVSLLLFQYDEREWLLFLLLWQGKMSFKFQIRSGEIRTLHLPSFYSRIIPQDHGVLLSLNKICQSSFYNLAVWIWCSHPAWISWDPFPSNWNLRWWRRRLSSRCVQRVDYFRGCTNQLINL